MSAAPRLETPRLVLRPHRVADFEAEHALWCEPKVYQHITGKPSAREESWARLLRYPGHWLMMGYGFWAIEDKASGRFIGEAGLATFQRDMEPAIGDTPEMGWILSTAWHGKGLGTEVLAAIIAWAKANLAAKDCACIIAPENIASQALARKMGFIDHGLARYKGDICVLLRLQLRG